MSTDRTHPARLSRGIASTELVLFLPVFLVLMLIPIHITRMMHTRLETVADARTLASLPDYMRGPGSFDLDRTRYGEQKLKLAADGDPDRSWQVVEEMRSAGRSPGGFGDSSRLTRVLDGVELQFSQADSASLYLAHPKLKWGAIPVRGRAGLVHDSIWLRETLPIGYDNFMHNRLDSQRMFNGFFPCQTGNELSADRRSGC
jgi:hypothetical protein